MAAVPHTPAIGTSRSSPCPLLRPGSAGAAVQKQTRARKGRAHPPSPGPSSQAAGSSSPGLGEHLASCPPDCRRRALLAVKERGQASERLSRRSSSACSVQNQPGPSHTAPPQHRDPDQVPETHPGNTNRNRNNKTDQAPNPDCVVTVVFKTGGGVKVGADGGDGHTGFCGHI